MPLSKQLLIRLTAHEKDLIKQKAKNNQLSVNQYLRCLLLGSLKDSLIPTNRLFLTTYYYVKNLSQEISRFRHPANEMSREQLEQYLIDLQQKLEKIATELEKNRDLVR